MMKHLTILIVSAFVLFPVQVYGQQAQSLSVTPPLFQISVSPGDTWQSAVKVVNSNAYPLTVYADAVNFAPEGEDGTGRLTPVLDDPGAAGATLAEWISVAAEAVTIPPEQSREITFVVSVPEDAPPGGHYAAILVSTEPPEEGGAVAVRTSQVVTSLFFLRVGGDVVEAGRIREFSVDDAFSETPAADFTLRFENTGNVHLQPRGDIVVRNMWGKERGVIPINHQSSFGNVLPESIREYTFSWNGEPSLADLGRYTAVVAVGYGENGVKSDSAELSFWVIPLKATLITLGVLLAVILAVAWIIRLYIRRMLALAGVDIESMEHVGQRRTLARTRDVMIPRKRDLFAPLRLGYADLRERLAGVREVPELFGTLWRFLVQYRVFFAALAVLIIIFAGAVAYLAEVSKEQRSYEVTVEEDGEERTLSSEEIIKERLGGSAPTADAVEQPFTLTLLNASGEAGRAAELAVLLESRGYRVDELSADTSRTQKAHVVVSDEPLLTEAEALSEVLGGVLISTRSPEGGEDDPHAITLIVGSAPLPE